MTDHTQEHKFVIARNEVICPSHVSLVVSVDSCFIFAQAFHFYTSEAKAQCLAFEGRSLLLIFNVLQSLKVVFPNLNSGEKFLIRWYRGYLISVSKGGRVGGGRGAALSSSSGGSGESMTLTIYDIQNQFLGE